MQKIQYRRGKLSDLKLCIKFTDWWLAGRAKRNGVKGAGNDYFISPNQHKSYLKNSVVWLAVTNKEKLVGWSVKSQNNSLFHLLIDSDYRGCGIGKNMLMLLNPDVIRSKTDQQTGDPTKFYERMGYVAITNKLVGKKKNILLMVKKI